MEHKQPLKIAFSGPSGIGKTTLARYVSEAYGLPFISSSMSDLVPESKNLVQQKLIRETTWERLLMANRHNLYKQHEGWGFVTDRSFLDSITYFIYKLGQDTREDNESTRGFLIKAVKFLSNDFTHIFLMNLDFGAKWDIENNEKRNTNLMFQWSISHLMMGVLHGILSESAEVGIEPISTPYHPDKVNSFRLLMGNHPQITIISSLDFKERKDIINTILG